MIRYLKEVHNFKNEEITILMDDGQHTHPTRANIEKAFHELAFSCQAGDAVFFHFAGHGGTTPDLDGDETDGYLSEESMYPVDYMEQGEIIDDDIFKKLLVPLPQGVHMTAVVDCCHSGTIFDLPFEYDEEMNKTNYKRVNMDGSSISHNEDEDVLERVESTHERQKRQPETSKGNNPRPEKKQSPALGQPTVSFPLEARVILHGLVKKPYLNGMTGIIRSGISCGRQRVYFKGTAKTAAVKPDNLELDNTPLRPTSKMESTSQKVLKKAILVLEPAESTQERQKRQPETSNGNCPRQDKTQSPALGQPTVSFPLEARVILHGLVKKPYVNGMTGIIRSGLSDGRQRVYIEGTAKTATVKPDNLELDDSPLRPTSKMESTSQKLLKKIILVLEPAESTQERQKRQPEASDGNSPRQDKTQSPLLGQRTVPFPLEARVIIHGLVKKPYVNGMTGIILSGLSDGRQRVYIEGTAKTATIKPDNLKLDDTPLRPTSKMESKSHTEAKLPRRKRTKREQDRLKRKQIEPSPTTNMVQKFAKANGTKKPSLAIDAEVKRKGGSRVLGLSLLCLGGRR
jgi:hypothetical protein